MKRIFFASAAILWLYGCDTNSPSSNTSKDTITPQNATGATPNNPGGLKPSSGSNTNGSNIGGGDTTSKGMNNKNHDSMR